MALTCSWHQPGLEPQIREGSVSAIKYSHICCCQCSPTNSQFLPKSAWCGSYLGLLWVLAPRTWGTLCPRAVGWGGSCPRYRWEGGFVKVHSWELNWAFPFTWDVHLPLRSHFRHELSLPTTSSWFFSFLLHPWQKNRKFKRLCKYGLSEANLFSIVKVFSVFLSPEQAQGSLSWALQRWHLSSNNWTNWAHTITSALGFDFGGFFCLCGS